MSEATKRPWWTDTAGRGNDAHNVICASLGKHGTQVVVDDLNAGYLLDPDERYANAAFIVEAVNNYESLRLQLANARKALDAAIHLINVYRKGEHDAEIESAFDAALKDMPK